VRRKGVALVGLALLALWLLARLTDRPPGPTGGWMAAAGVSPRFETVSAGGRPLTVRYVRRGAGRPVLLIHGLCSSLVTWRRVLPLLAEDRDVIAMDLPGFGGSEIPEPLTPALLSEAVLGLLSNLHLPRVSLVGNSLGGGIAAGIAAEHPERVERLVLVDSVGFGRDETDWPATLRLASRFGGILDHLPLRRVLVVRALHEVFYDPAFVTPEEVDEYLAPLSRPGASAATRSLLASSRTDAGRLREEIIAIRAPTLILWGREDRWIPAAHAGLFASAIPGARAVILEECGHLPQEERPDEVARLIRSFLPP
jgi:pimeloyl-ACP methyl ester carboxylesterase